MRTTRKEYFHCGCIVERDKRMRNTERCLYRNASCRKLKLETAYDPQQEILHMRANPACVNKSRDTKIALKDKKDVPHFRRSKIIVSGSNFQHWVEFPFQIYLEKHLWSC
jgi:hypothetical protein